MNNMNTKNRKFLIIIEWLWLIMAVFCLIVGIYYHLKIGLANSWIIYMLSIISLGMFFMRRMQRKNMEKRQNRS